MAPVPAKKRRTSAKRKAQESGRVVGYLRVSTAEQAASGLGLDAQRAIIEARCVAEGWTVVEWCEDAGVSGSVEPTERPGMARALELIDSREAGGLVAAKLDRLTRKVAHALAMRDRATRDGWRLTLLDLGMDTGTPGGLMMFTVFAAGAEFQRGRIAEDTRNALAAKKAQGKRLGRPITAHSQASRARLRELLHDGLKLGEIAQQLNDEGYTTPTGLQWTWKHVQRTRDSLALDDQAALAAR